MMKRRFRGLIYRMVRRFQLVTLSEISQRVGRGEDWTMIKAFAARFVRLNIDEDSVEVLDTTLLDGVVNVWE